MSWSRSEFSALAAKAARGAGAPAEQAARFGQAAATHLAAQRGEEALLLALGSLERGPVLTCPLRVDAALCQAANGIAHLVVDDADRLFDSYVESLPYLTTKIEGSNNRSYTINCRAVSERAIATRLFPSDDLITGLRTFAKAILVPDSDASRSSGAGAGLNDND